MIQIQKQVWSKRTIYLLITDGGSVQLDIYTQPQEEYGIRAFIHNLWIQPYCRKQGKAKELLDKAEHIVHDLDIDAVYLKWEAADTPTWMLDHYNRRGYEKIEWVYGYALLKKVIKRNNL